MHLPHTADTHLHFLHRRLTDSWVGRYYEMRTRNSTFFQARVSSLSGRQKVSSRLAHALLVPPATPQVLEETLKHFTIRRKCALAGCVSFPFAVSDMGSKLGWGHFRATAGYPWCCVVAPCWPLNPCKAPITPSPHHPSVLCLQTLSP